MQSVLAGNPKRVEQLYQKMRALHGATRIVMEEWLIANSAQQYEAANWLASRHSDLCKRAKAAQRAWERARARAK